MSDRFPEALEAIRAGDLLAVLALLGARPELASARHAADPERNNRPTLLHFAAIPMEPAAPDIARALIEAGAAVDAPDAPEGGATPLAWAAAADQADVADALLDAGAATEGRPDDPSGMTPLEHALFLGNAAVAVRLARRGARATFPLAAGLGRADVVGEGFEDATDIERVEALFFAAVNDRSEVLEALVERGLPPDPAHDGFGGVLATPLHWAALHGCAGAAATLLRLGADPTLHDAAFHRTPAGWAREHGHPELAAELVAAEASRGLGG